MGSVNGVPDYINTVKIGSRGVVSNTTKQGGIVAIYYFGAMFGCFIGGRLGDKYGRKRAVIIGSIFTLIGGGLQSGSQSAAMSLVARVIVGLGIGFINAVNLYIPPSPLRHPLIKENRSFQHGYQN
jgi:MFS family permease